MTIAVLLTLLSLLWLAGFIWMNADGLRDTKTPFVAKPLFFGLLTDHAQSLVTTLALVWLLVVAVFSALNFVIWLLK